MFYNSSLGEAKERNHRKILAEPSVRQTGNESDAWGWKLPIVSHEAKLPWILIAKRSIHSLDLNDKDRLKTT